MPAADGRGGTAAAGSGASASYVIAASLVATLAFWAYTRTLLPGVDLGDTGGFQAAVLWPETSARRAYPLYYAIAAPFVEATSGANPARGLNLFSAVCAAFAVGLAVWLTARITRSALAGIAAGLLLAFSYTFWTQAIIAEVYPLHLALVAACFIGLHAFAARPTRLRLAAALGIFALSFGNHLSTILLFVPCAMFILVVHPRPRQLFRPAVVGLALALAVAGALQYAANFLSVWSSIDAPAAWGERVAAFWFDTTKADWRESMVLGVSGADLRGRLAMWAWDARQQFGVAGLALAVFGAVRLWRTSRPSALLLLVAYVISTLFALTYNVGDTHVFFLPGHLFTAVAAGAAVAAWPAHDGMRRAVAFVLIAYAGWRGWETWPAADRSGDRRAEALVARLVQGIDDRDAILVSRMDWQTENALLYASRYERRDVAWTRLDDVLLHFPFLVGDNQAIGRDVVLTADAAAEVIAAFGPAFTIVDDTPLPAVPMAEIVTRLPSGTPYVLTLLTPPGDERFDAEAFDRILRGLSGDRTPARQPGGLYEVWAGLSGEPPDYTASDRPFHRDLPVAGDTYSIRMDAWLPFDTFRRGGFGRVLRGRESLLTIERGASLVWLQRDGRAAQAYGGGLYAPEPRFRIPAGATLVAGVAALP